MVFHRIVFSPTGGTEKTADVIFSQISDEAVKTDL